MQEKRYVGHQLRMITNLIKRQIIPVDDKITGMQGLILRYIHKEDKDNKEVFQKDIEHKFNIRRSTATGILNNLEKNGYIIRQTSEKDARLKKLILTEKAEMCRKMVERDIERIEAIATKDITEKDLEDFFRITDKIKSNLEGKDLK